MYVLVGLDIHAVIGGLLERPRKVGHLRRVQCLGVHHVSRVFLEIAGGRLHFRGRLKRLLLFLLLLVLLVMLVMLVVLMVVVMVVLLLRLLRLYRFRRRVHQIGFGPLFRVHLLAVALRPRENMIVGHVVRRQPLGRWFLDDGRRLFKSEILVAGAAQIRRQIRVDLMVLEVLVELRRWRRRRRPLRLVERLRVTLLCVEHHYRGRRLLQLLRAVVIGLVTPIVVDLLVMPVKIERRPEVERVRRFASLDGRVAELTERAQYGGRRLRVHFDLIGSRGHRLLRLLLLLARPIRVPDWRRDVYHLRDSRLV